MLPMTTASLSSDPIADLWLQARAWFADLVTAFGQPAEIAALAREACAALRRELAALRAFVFKLLLIEAARLAGPHCRPVHAPRIRCAAARPAPRVHDLACPVTWRLRFSLAAPREQLRRRRSARARPRPVRAPRPLDLARACEALRRVLADPAATVARLARKLCALGARAFAAARRIALFRPRAVSRRSMSFAAASVRAHDHASHFQDSC